VFDKDFFCLRRWRYSGNVFIPVPTENQARHKKEYPTLKWSWCPKEKSLTVALRRLPGATKFHWILNILLLMNPLENFLTAIE